MRTPKPVAAAIVLIAALLLTGQSCEDDPTPPQTPDPPVTEPPPMMPEPPQELTLATQAVVSGLEQPLFLTAPRGDERLFIVEQPGRIRIVADGQLRPGPFLDIRARVLSGGERGLLGLAFPDDYAASGLFYVNYTDVDGDTIVARYTRGGGPNVADPSSEEVLLKIGQPFGNHNGGMLAFGPDGFLYVATGDGGSANDPDNRAQNDATLLGKMLRIDVSGGAGSGYSIPPSNPFAGGALPLQEIWAKGLRNPYRFSFDRLMGDVYIGDVGQNAREEIDVEPMGFAGGANYGWRRMEGSACLIPSAGCNDGSLTLPVHEYLHAGGRCSVTGGYVYRGAIEQIFGHYFFADFCSGEVFSFVWDGASGVVELTDRTAELEPSAGFRSITSFGEDGFGELYIVQFGGGTVLRIVALAAPAARPSATRR